MKNVTIFHSCHSDYVCFYAKDWIYCTLKVGQICSFVENHYGKMTEYSGKVSFQKKVCTDFSTPFVQVKYILSVKIYNTFNAV